MFKIINSDLVLVTEASSRTCFFFLTAPPFFTWVVRRTRSRDIRQRLMLDALGSVPCP